MTKIKIKGMKIVGKYIKIKVMKNYTYSVEINGLGEMTDKPAIDTMWGWINHLRSKTWWNNFAEKEFIKLSEIVVKNYL